MTWIFYIKCKLQSSGPNFDNCFVFGSRSVFVLLLMNESCFLVAKLGCLQCVIDLCNEIYDKLQQPPLKFHKILITLSSNISKNDTFTLEFYKCNW